MDMTPAMKARLQLPLLMAFDIRNSHIQLFADWELRRYVKTVLPASQYVGMAALADHGSAARAQATTLWRQKYGVEMPGDVEVSWAETTSANSIPHEGPTILTVAEQSVVDKALDFGDFTLDMLWLMVEGLGWKPGKPVAEDDPGWLVILAEEEESGGYLDIIRAVLGMPEPPVPTYCGWQPPAVIEAYKQTTLTA